jgi:hypothetical protein
LREVVETEGCSARCTAIVPATFFVTPKRGERVDTSRPTQVGRALQELGVKMIPAYSPQARGRSERNFGTWQGRLPQELRVRGITDLAEPTSSSASEYIAEFNSVYGPAAQKGQRLCACPAQRSGLDLQRAARTHGEPGQHDHVENRVFQLDKTRWRNTLAGQTVVVHEHLDGRVSIRYGPHVIAQYASDELPPQAPKRRGTPRLPIGRVCQTKPNPKPDIPHMQNEAKPKTGH